MTRINASAATEGVSFALGSYAFFQKEGPVSSTEYSWLDKQGHDISAKGHGFDTTGTRPDYGFANSIEIDLSNNDYANPDILITDITPDDLSGSVSTALLADLTDSGADAFFNELMTFNDTVTGSSFNDTMKAGGGSDSLTLGTGNDAGYGDAGNDTLYGGLGNDTLYGDSIELFGPSSAGGNDRLEGGAGNDKLNGQGGNDTLIGGTGSDMMDGGRGNDIFVFESAFDSTSGNPDTIKNFGINGNGNGNDRINLSALGVTDFEVLGASGSPGAHTVGARGMGQDTFLYVNTDTDAAVEMVIIVKDGDVPASAWDSGDFILA